MIKRNPYIILYILFLSSFFFFVSCSKDETMDFQGQTRPPETNQLTYDSIIEFKNLAYANESQYHFLDLYVPYTDTFEHSFPLIIWIHGCFDCGTKSNPSIVHILKEYAMQGFVVASVDYRLLNEAKWPDQVYDVKASARWLKAKAKNYQIDTSSIGVFGASAGGVLASLLGVASHDNYFSDNLGEYTSYTSDVDVVISMSGIYDYSMMYNDCMVQTNFNTEICDSVYAGIENLFGCSSARNCSAIEKLSSATSYVHGDLPEFMLLHSSREGIPLVQAQRFHDMLENAGKDVPFLIKEGGFHGSKLFEFYKSDIIAYFIEKLK